MQTDHIKEFLILSQTLNFRIAAEILGVSESSLSKHVSTLEADLKVKLFDRGGNGTKLTTEGERIAPLAKQVLAILDSMSFDSSGGIKRLRVGVPVRYDTYARLASRSFTLMHVAHPDISCEMIEMPLSGYPIQELTHGRCDVVLSYGPCNFGSIFHHETLASLPARIWLDASNPLHENETISVTDLDDYSLIRPYGDEGGYWAQTAIDQLEKFGSHPKIGPQSDGTLRIGSKEFALVFSAQPSPALGDNAVSRPVEESLTFDMVAVCLRVRNDETVRTYLEILHKAARQLKLQETTN